MIEKLLRSMVAFYTNTIDPRAPRLVRRLARKLYISSGAKAIVWTPHGLYEWYSKAAVFREGDLVFDIGANKGFYSEAFLRLGARVVSVEPNPACAATLRRKFSTNKRVSIVEAAAGARKGRARLLLGEVDEVSTLSPIFGSFIRRRMSYDYPGEALVRLTTLEALIGEYGVPAYCKIDVEGFERQVLLGLHRKIPVVSFEFHKDRLGEAAFCASRLEKFGKASFRLASYDFGAHKSMLSGWKSRSSILAEIKKGSLQSGDIYCKYI